MVIGIIGSGNVGGALGEGWARLGHKVVFGSRQPESQEMRDLVRRAGSNASAATMGEAVAASEVVVAALPWPVARPVLQSLDLRGKTLLDCMNPLRPDLSALELGTTTSGGEQVAQWAAGASVVKIFNTTGNNNMANSKYPGGAPAMFYCGDDPSAKSKAAQLAAELGFEPVDAGPLSNARLLEPAAMLWIWLAIRGGLGREFAFHLLRR